MMDFTCGFKGIEMMLDAVNTHITKIRHSFNTKIAQLFN
jgi:hypothetical protein